MHFGHFVIDRATKCTANIVNNLNSLWNPGPPSGKSITDMLRAIKLQRFRATAHKNAIQSIRKKEGYLSGAWGDNEKLAYVRSTVEEKMDKYDPATKHPKNWLAFLLCSHPIDYFTGRCLSLITILCSATSWATGHVEVLPSADLQNLERNSGGSGTVSKGPKKRVVAGSSEGNSTVSNSSFTHTVQLVSNRKDYEELAHIKQQVATIKDAISTLENFDTVGYAEELINLRNELAVAVLHQVKMMKLCTEEYKHSRAAEVAADNFAKQLVTTATHSVFPRSTPLSALGSLWAPRCLISAGSVNISPTKNTI